MTAHLLLKALCVFLQNIVSDYASAQGEKGEFKTPQVFDWYLPFKNPKVPEKIDFPYIVGRIIDGEDAVDSKVKIELSFGVYNEGTKVNEFVHPDGAYDLLNLMEHVRIALLEQGLIDGKFQIEKPYKWNIPEDQPYPLWVGQAQTIWNVQSVMENIDIDLHAHKFEWEGE